MPGYRFDKKLRVEDCLELSVFYLQRNKLLEKECDFILKWGQNSINCRTLKRESQTHLYLSYTKEGESISYINPLTTTSLPWGGEKYWFVCCLVKGGRGCQRRVAKLYLPPGGKYFGCRHCYGLTYRSSQEHYQRADELAKDPHALLQAIEADNSPIAFIKALGKRSVL